MAEVKTPLPPLTKQTSTYKLIVPEKVEEKIRYLIRKFPHTEWSGILFYNHTGGFETNDLVITCQDIFPMDLGTAGFTTFKMTPDVSSYIAQNLELFDCDMGLVHSHHTLGAFFSGQDTTTLQLEGKDTNCFVSLIVDTKGTYQAAVTRKVKQKAEVTVKDLGSSYEFFGEGAVPLNAPKETTTTKQIEKEEIQYFMLDVERHEVSNHLEYLDERFEDIEKTKKAAKPVASSSVTYPKVFHDYDDFYQPDYTFREYLREKEEAKEQTLWDDETMKEMEVTPDIDPKAIKLAVNQMVTCSFILGDKFNFDTWVKNHLASHYEKIFETDEAFDEWCSFIVGFQLDHFKGFDPKKDDLAPVAQAMQDELAPYADFSPYIAEYCKELDTYIYS